MGRLVLGAPAAVRLLLLGSHSVLAGSAQKQETKPTVLLKQASQPCPKLTCVRSRVGQPFNSGPTMPIFRYAEEGAETKTTGPFRACRRASLLSRRNGRDPNRKSLSVPVRPDDH